MSKRENAIKKQQAIANNIFVRRVKQYENFDEYKKYNKSWFETYEEEKMFINGKVRWEMEECSCKDNTDVRIRCSPMGLAFIICPLRCHTACWFIENGIFNLSEFKYLGKDNYAEIRRLIKQE